MVISTSAERRAVADSCLAAKKNDEAGWADDEDEIGCAGRPSDDASEDDARSSRAIRAEAGPQRGRFFL